MAQSIKILRMREDLRINQKHNHLSEPHIFQELEDKRIYLYPRPGDVVVSSQIKNSRVLCQ